MWRMKKIPTCLLGAVAKIDELIFTRHFDTIVMSAIEKPMRKQNDVVFRGGFE